MLFRSLGEDDVLAAAVDDEGAITPLADALVDGALLDPAHLVEEPTLLGDDPPTDSLPVCGKNVHRSDAMGR